MEILNKLNLNLKAVLKIFAIIFVGLLLLMLLFQVLGSFFRSVSPFDKTGSYMQDSLYSAKNIALEESLSSYGVGGAPMISSRNVMSDYDDGMSTGATAEDFEITNYYGSIETRHLEDTCAQISSLKAKDYVIFENANQSDNSCYFSFKVKQENKEEILDLIENLDPKDLQENTRTIKQQIDDYTSETEILEKKMKTIENTLDDAIRSYDEISRVATQARDAESLAKIIDSKIRIIERLSQERIQISEQIDRISRAKAEQLDRLAYVYFNINVYENKFVDGEQIKDSWKSEIKRSVREISEIAQNMSINLVTAGFTILQYLVYIFLLFIAGKYFWRLAVRFWKR